MLDEQPRGGRQGGKVADADGELPQRPGILEGDDGDRGGAGGPAGRGLGHDAEADARLDHAADRVEAAQLHPQPERAADPGRLVGKEALQRARPVEADEIVAEDVGEGDLCRCGEGVAGAAPRGRSGRSGTDR